MPDRRRGFLKAIPGALLALELPLANSATVLAVRVWPAADYTRVTLELDEPLRTAHFTVPDPPRLVLDLEGVTTDAALRGIVAKVQADDPYIAAVRVGQNRPGVTRLVFDLKAPVLPRVFALDPIDRYRHRLVLDLHPAAPPDPLAQLIERARGASSATGGSGAAAGAADDDPIAGLIRERDPAQPARAARPAVTRMVTIAIDPGHGGEDPGAIGPGGTMEKDVVLAVATRLRERIDAQPGMRAFMTRDADFFVPLATRVAKARAVKADLFVSVHADAFVQPDARGSSVFVLSDSGATSLGARWLARRENRADLIGGVDLGRRDREVASVLLDLSTSAQIRDSRRLGSAVLGELRTVGDVHKTAVEQAGFAVLRAPDIPSILVETAFISNPDEERRLRDPRHQVRIADAIFEGIQRHFRRHPPGPRGRMA